MWAGGGAQERLLPTATRKGFMVTGIYELISALTTESDGVFADGQADGSITTARVRQLMENVVASLAPAETTLTFSTTLAWALDTNPVAIVTLTGNTTITLSAGQSGRCYRLAVIQDATGSRTVTLAGCTTLGTPVWSTAANSINLISVDVANSTRYVVVS